MTKDIPTPEELHKLLRCDPKAGLLYWRERTPDMFRDGKQTAEHSCAAWNSRYAEQEAFTARHSDGYLLGTIFGRMHRSHSVIWAMVYGEWPPEEIDHINGSASDNRIVNLRSVTHAVNMKNARIRKDNTSGVMGVSLHKPTGKWVARIYINGHRKHLGCFTSKIDAVAAKKTAEVKYGYHPNHGRPAA